MKLLYWTLCTQHQSFFSWYIICISSLIEWTCCKAALCTAVHAASTLTCWMLEMMQQYWPHTHHVTGCHNTRHSMASLVLVLRELHLVTFMHLGGYVTGTTPLIFTYYSVAYFVCCGWVDGWTDGWMDRWMDMVFL